MEEEFVDDAARHDGTITKENVTDAIDTREHFGPLVTHPGWLKLVEAAEVQMATRMSQIMQHAQTQDEVFAKEGLINEVNGIKFFIELPKILLQNAQDIIEAYEAQAEAQQEAAEEMEEMEQDDE